MTQNEIPDHPNALSMPHIPARIPVWGYHLCAIRKIIPDMNRLPNRNTTLLLSQISIHVPFGMMGVDVRGRGNGWVEWHSANANPEISEIPNSEPKIHE